ncbi:MAG: Acyl-CoA dehydrogenase [Acidimicrobiales bacterium]|nr:Acyl-CoA dehydrogenase [Acidimicrobiales bacterium]
MDFTLSDEQVAIRDLAARILTEQLPPERLREIETSDDEWFARDVWAELAKADLLGICLPEAHGGGGYGFFELALILEQAGKAVAPLPLHATLALGALPIAHFGSADQQAALLPLVASGDLVLTAALSEGGIGYPPEVPATAATRDGDGWKISGTKHLVPAAHLAGRVLVAARTGDTTSTVFLVDPSADGVTAVWNRSANGEPLSTMTFTDVTVAAGDVLGEVDAGAEVVAWTTDRGVAAWCAVQAGVCEAALRLTATYTSERKQFDTPIATFQAVAHRAADAYIDTEAVRLTAYQAAWRLAEGHPAAEELAIAKFWAAEGAQRVVHAAQHLHGGIGVDLDYPVHRAFRWAKHVELSLGGGTTHLRRLGALLAAG